MPSNTTTFEVQGEAPDFGKVPDFKAGTYKKGDLIRNTDDFKVYRAKKKIEVKQFNQNDWESTDVFYEVEMRLRATNLRTIPCRTRPKSISILPVSSYK